MPDEDAKQTEASPGARQPWFVTTSWTVVLNATDQTSPQATEALEKLCRTYWYPLYAYVRRLGQNGEDAQDLTQAFFAHLLEKNSIALADPQRGKFRTFLLTAMKNFLAKEHAKSSSLKRGGGANTISFDSPDAEDRYGVEPVELSTPETLYERRWAFTVLENAFHRLREEYTAAGRGAWFEQLKDFVWGERNSESYAEIAQRLDLTEEAVKKSVQRLRQRFRDALRAEIAHTVTTVGEVETELRHIVEVLRR